MEQTEVSLNIEFEGDTMQKEGDEEANKGVEYSNEINEEELNKVRLMRAFVESQDPSSKEVDDMMLRRFLRARDLDIEKGFDKNQRPITVVFGGRHFHNKGGLDEFKRFVVFGLDKLCSGMPRGQEKFVVIGDLEGWGYSNSDIRGYLGALSILQDYYPERLGKLFIVHVPRIFMAVWKIVYPFIDNTTKKKIIFVENKKLKSTLLEDIDESQIPEIYGGKLQLVPIQDN